MKPRNQRMLGPGICFAESSDEAKDKAHKSQVILSAEVKVGIQNCT
jgi:hypothetical protein